MDDPPPRIGTHEAVDRFGKVSLRTAHELTAALAANDDADEEPVVVRRAAGPHRSIDGLAALLDAALAEEDAGHGRPPADPGGRTGAGPRSGA